MGSRSRFHPRDNWPVDDRSLQLLTLLSAHAIFLSAGALRILRGQREHELVGQAPWWIQYYPPLVWLPFLPLYFKPLSVDLDPALQHAGLAMAAVGAVFAATAMWSLGRSYGIRTDVFKGARLHTRGVYAIVRHPMYLGIVVFHLGASLSLESPLLLAVTAVVVVPYTALRIRAEEKVLREVYGNAYADYQRRVPALVPFLRAAEPAAVA